MSIKDDITVMAGKRTISSQDVETKSTVKHADTGEVYASEEEARPTSTTLQLTQQKMT